MPTPKVARSVWSLREGTVTKRFTYFGLSGDWSAHTLQMDIDSKPSRFTGLLEPSFRLMLKPSPLLDWDDGYLDGQMLLSDTPKGDQKKMLVMIENSDDGTLVISSTSAEDAADFVDKLCSGRDMQFVLLDDDERLLELPLPNDPGVYDLFRKALI